MIFITGDTHRKLDIQKLEPDNFSEQELMSREDYLIIAGDFGGVWTGDSGDDDILNYHEEKSYTTLFIGGNHENYDALNTYPIVRFQGGLAHQIRPHVLHLMNGQIYRIQDKSFFIMGGATSLDKMYRIPHETWWEEEEPFEEDYQLAWENLEKHNFQVDYVITHTIPELVRYNAFAPYKNFMNYESRVEKFLDDVLKEVSYQQWFAGHIHIDKELPDYRMRILFNSIVLV